jgi:hypothetical protein
MPTTAIWRKPSGCKKTQKSNFWASIWPSIQSYWACVTTLFLGGIDKNNHLSDN